MNDKLQGERARFEAAWPEISKAGIDNGWRGVAEAAWQARAALASDAEPVAVDAKELFEVWATENGTYDLRPARWKAVSVGGDPYDGYVRPYLQDRTVYTYQGFVAGLAAQHTAPPSTAQAVEAALWYLGAMNDGLFIIDKPPRPSTDEVWHDRPDGPDLVLNVTDLPREKAQAIVDAHNAALIPTAQGERDAKDAEGEQP